MYYFQSVLCRRSQRDLLQFWFPDENCGFLLWRLAKWVRLSGSLLRTSLEYRDRSGLGCHTTRTCVVWHHMSKPNSSLNHRGKGNSANSPQPLLTRDWRLTWVARLWLEGFLIRETTDRMVIYSQVTHRSPHLTAQHFYLHFSCWRLPCGLGL